MAGEDLTGAAPCEDGGAELFRPLNDWIVSLAGSRPVSEYALVCECCDPSCLRVLRMPPAAYADLRSREERFAVLPGHERPGLETAVERAEAYVVVERPGAVARSAGEGAAAEPVPSFEALAAGADRRRRSRVEAWLGRSSGFRVVGDGREGAVEAVRGDRERVGGLIVRFGHELVFIRASRVRAIDPERRLVVLDEG